MSASVEIAGDAAAEGEPAEEEIGEAREKRLLLVDPLARSARPLPDAPEGVFGGAHLQAWDAAPTVAGWAP